MQALIASVLLAACAAGGCLAESLPNATGHQATGLRVVFSEKVTIDDHDDSLPNVSTTGKAAEITLSGGRVPVGTSFRLSWRPGNASLVDYEWQYTGSDRDGPVAFADPGLEDALRGAVPRLAGPIRGAELASITQLDADGREIASLAGLEQATDLTVLGVSDNQITDLSPLAELAKLRHLDLGLNMFEDLSPLRDLSALEELYVEGNYISDISPLAALVNLTTLDVSFNSLADLTPLARLTRLTDLRMKAVGARDLSVVSGMTSLWRLDASWNDIDDVEPLASLTELVGLDVSRNRIEDLTPLAGLTKLKVLEAEGNLIRDVSPLARLMRLSDLGLGVNEVRDISPLSALTGLRTLILYHNGITDVSPLGRLPALWALDLAYNEVLDVSSLARLETLEYLVLAGNHVRDMSPLIELENLQTLQLQGNELASLKPFKGMGRLWWLDLSGNRIATLEGFPSGWLEADSSDGVYGGYDFSCFYANIDLSGNQIADLAPLVAALKAKSGYWIDLRGNPLDLSPGSLVLGQLEALQATQAQVCTGTLVNTESFEDGGDWYQGADAAGKIEVAGGEYRMALQPEESLTVWSTTAGPFLDQLRVSIDAEWERGAEVVVAIVAKIRGNDEEDCSFLVRSSGEVSFTEWSASAGVMWRSDWTPCPASVMNPEKNRLAMTLTGESVVCELNGTMVLVVPLEDDPWLAAEGGYVGLYVENLSTTRDARIQFDDLVMEELR